MMVCRELSLLFDITLLLYLEVKPNVSAFHGFLLSYKTLALAGVLCISSILGGIHSCIVKRIKKKRKALT